MQIVTLIQGTPEWHAHRAQHFNASDAPAMMGCSPYKTRAELVRERATGLTAEVDAAQQRRFDMGHRAEALARPLAEQILGEELSPLVGVADLGPYSASFDGLTLMEDQAFEHKALNDTLRAAMVEGCTGADLPMAYQVQMEHQCMVCPSIERVLFMASKWGEDGTLIEERHCFYEPNLALRARIVAGWDQLEQDVAAYVPEAPKPAPVVAAPMDALPAVSVQVQGGLQIVSNLPAFGDALKAFIDRIPAEPSTDQEFADTEAACKALKRAEDALEASESNALAQLADVDTMRRLVADYRGLARTTRLQREKLVAQRKEQLRGEIVANGVAALRAHVDALNKRTGRPYMPTIDADFGGAIKGKKNLDSMRDAVATELARAKIAANEIADRIQTNLDTIRNLAGGYTGMFPDEGVLVLKAPEDCEAQVQARVAKRKADDEARLQAQRERIAAEERERAEAEAAAKLEADRARIRAEEEERARAAQAAAEAERQRQMPTPAPPAPVAPPPALQPAPELQPVATVAPAANEAPAGPPTLRIGAIGERLGWTLTAEQLRGMGIEPAGRERAATLYHESQFPAICDAVMRRAAEAKTAHQQRQAA
ncbi:lambda-exonuclease family protein [Pseudacidovorax intermedius]|uniref:YqaJ viral recombinase domain-containing protein n=1 Tax=Pseudacidovorax intermedius TaxID=433924 RepID=A0A147GL08_9BURK|nr:YqaJ viral recombinase family protein [Pseudacidovorax intermedius]KTT11522.1 hypothetical protein NS331_24815 [Pseudacidovorax intermedius]